MKRLPLMVAMLLGAKAHAQGAANLPSTATEGGSQGALPTTPTQPSGQGTATPYYPGMPVPQPPAAKTPPPRGDGKEPARAGLFVDGDYSVSATTSTAAPSETHVVQKGDTLWDLSSRYYGNAWGWPRMWSYNPQITNPHWIYPGDIIRVFPPGAAMPADAAAEEGPARIAPPPAATRGVFLRQTGFVERGELMAAGKIVGSKEEKLMLGALDEAYVECKKDQPLAVGQRYTVYRPTRKVKHPVSGKLLGHMVEIFGEGEVRSVTEGQIARIAVIDSVNPIERGFLVGPLRRQFKTVPPVADKVDLEGVIVASLQPRQLIGAGHLVFLDRGQKDGVEIGNRFLVTRRGDGYQPLRVRGGPIDDKRFPRERIAEIVVVDLRDHLATGFVTSSIKEARVGDRVESRRGF